MLCMRSSGAVSTVLPKMRWTGKDLREKERTQHVEFGQRARAVRERFAWTTRRQMRRNATKSVAMASRIGKDGARLPVKRHNTRGNV